MATPTNPYGQGSQTLARGLHALQFIADSGEGMSAADIARSLGIHQSIAYRILNTLSHFGLARRDLDGRYRIGVGVMTLAQAARSGLRVASLPVMRQLATTTNSTCWLFAEEGEDAVALVAVEPSTMAYANRFLEGSKHPLSRGSAGYALLSLRPPNPSEPDKVKEARQHGYAMTYAEVATGAWGVAAPLDPQAVGFHACINVASGDRHVAEAAVGPLLQAVAELTRILNQSEAQANRPSAKSPANTKSNATASRRATGSPS